VPLSANDISLLPKDYTVATQLPSHNGLLLHVTKPIEKYVKFVETSAETALLHCEFQKLLKQNTGIVSLVLYVTLTRVRTGVHSDPRQGGIGRRRRPARDMLRAQRELAVLRVPGCRVPRNLAYRFPHLR
jgi:hypothetical protein